MSERETEMQHQHQILGVLVVVYDELRALLTLLLFSRLEDLSFPLKNCISLCVFKCLCFKMSRAALMHRCLARCARVMR